MHIVTTTGLDLHPAAQIEAATNKRRLYLGLRNNAAKKLLAKPAQSLAIIRLPDPVSQAVLLLDGKITNTFYPDLGSDLLMLLAEVVGVTLAARLELQDPMQ